MSWVAAVIKRLRPVAEPLPYERPTAEILREVDFTLGRLSKIREQATELIKRMDEKDA